MQGISYQIIKLVLISLVITAYIPSFSQCPTYDKRNNGQGTQGCVVGESPPAGKIKSGQFDFTSGSTSTNFTVDSIQLNGQLYQSGSTLYNSLGTIWFGGYNGSTQTICFYGNSTSDNAPPAGRWKFFFKNSGTQTICSYTLTTSGNLSSLTPGTIGSDQTICSGSTPTSFSNTSPASGCSSGSPTYQWQYSTTSSSSGFTNVPSGGTSSTYSPGALIQTTYYIRVATCSDGASAPTDPITITVVNAGSISATPSSWTAPATPTFSSTGTSGGTWTSSNTGVATIHASTGVLTMVAAGTTTITYSVLDGCTATSSVTITNNSGTLPVTWESVSAIKKDGKVQLFWSTASEQNTKDFEIQYSTNATEWTPLGNVTAAGNSSAQREYRYLHTNPLKNNIYNYYRINQRDLDGKSSYSKIVSILFNEPGPDMMVYPNPADDFMTIFVAEPQNAKLFSSAGTLIWQKKLSAGTTRIPVQNLSPGGYLLQIGKVTKRVVIQ